MTKVPITVINIFAYGAPFAVGSDSAEVPECCHPPDAIDTGVVQYTFKLHCESLCPDPTTGGTRKLASAITTPATPTVEVMKKKAHQNKVKEGEHFCSKANHPCGENGDMVNVCHYSAKTGYESFCVPEVDSDVVGYYPKDYCGKCEGGYSKIKK